MTIYYINVQLPNLDLKLAIEPKAGNFLSGKRETEIEDRDRWEKQEDRGERQRDRLEKYKDREIEVRNKETELRDRLEKYKDREIEVRNKETELRDRLEKYKDREIEGRDIEIEGRNKETELTIKILSKAGQPNQFNMFAYYFFIMLNVLGQINSHHSTTKVILIQLKKDSIYILFVLKESFIDV